MLDWRYSIDVRAVELHVAVLVLDLREEQDWHCYQKELLQLHQENHWQQEAPGHSPVRQQLRASFEVLDYLLLVTLQWHFEAAVDSQVQLVN